MEYTPLTKIIQTKNGKECVSCIYFGTDKCQIHNCYNCGNCEMFVKIMNRLNYFENFINETIEEGDIN